MPLPVRILPVEQNWDCHVSGNCCKEYQVSITQEEHQRIQAQGWERDPDFQKNPLFVAQGSSRSRQYRLYHHPDGSCVFLGPQGRCRIHERFGFEAKPLPCRLFPFILVPAGNHYRVGLRFACPSAAASKGRSLTAHKDNLREFAALLEKREGLPNKRGPQVLPPPLQRGQQVSWPDLLRFVDTLEELLSNRNDPVERRLRKCLALDRLCRLACFDRVQGTRLKEFLDLLIAGLELEVPGDPTQLPPPRWTGRILFRQALAVFTRKDGGPKRGQATLGRLRLLKAAWRFAAGRGAVPRLHAWVPEMNFAAAEIPVGPLPADAEALLERYYLIKIGSLQFCGTTNFGMPFWDGLEVLLLTFPILMWLRRGFTTMPPVEALTRALSIVDDNFGYHPFLGTLRQRLGFRLLARLGELERLIAWLAR
jgi:lysine-N-methylase